MADVAPLDRVNLRLAEIQGELWDLAEDDFEVRYSLKLEQARLRAEVRRLVGPDEHHPTHEQVAEMEARRSTLARVIDSTIDSAALPGGEGAGGHEEPDDGDTINAGIRHSKTVQPLTEPVARLVSLLDERGELKR